MRQALILKGQPEPTGIRPSSLPADNGTSNEVKQNLINSDRDVAAKQSIDNPATDDGGKDEPDEEADPDPVLVLR